MSTNRKSTISLKKSGLSDESDFELYNNDSGFIVDPEKIFDDLPQPYRLIDKTLNYIFDVVWEAIEKIEDERSELGAGGRVPVFDCAVSIPHFVQPSLFCASCDGKYIFVVAKFVCLSVFDACTSSVVASNEELHGACIMSLSSAYFDSDIYFICCVLDNGLSALFVFSNAALHLVKVFNEENGIKSSVTTSIDVSNDGNFIAVGWETPSKSSWLEVYKVPKELWINEIEQAEEATTKKQTDQPISTPDGDSANTLKNDTSDSEDETTGKSRPTSAANADGTQVGFVVETAFSKAPLLLKVKSPTSVVPNTASNVPAAFKMVDPDTVATGNNHVLMQPYFDNSLLAFKNIHKQYMQHFSEEEDIGSIRKPMVHFLTPGKLIPHTSETVDDVNSIVVYWSDSSNASLYSLLKATKDVERKADVMLRTSCRIVCSAVSNCGAFVSFCLENNNIVTWNVGQGVALNVLKPSRTGPANLLYFLPRITNKSVHEHGKLKLLVCYQNGDVYKIGYEPNDPTAERLSFPSSLTANDPVRLISHVSDIPQLAILQRASGRIAIIDIETNTVKCQVGLIKPLAAMTTFCYAHDTSTLFIKGGTKDDYDEEIIPESILLYSMNIDRLPGLEAYERKVKCEDKRDCNEQSLVSLCERMDKERMESQAKRERQRQTRWRQFQGELDRIKTTRTERSTLLTVK